MEILDPAGKTALLICDFCGANSGNAMLVPGNFLMGTRVAICVGCADRVVQTAARFEKEQAARAAVQAIQKPEEPPAPADAVQDAPQPMPPTPAAQAITFDDAQAS